MSAPRFAIVGHPNKGKSSIVATLAEDETVPISAVPGTTTRSRSFPMRLDGEVLYELIDTPGFQRPRGVLEWLTRHNSGPQARAASVAAFVAAHLEDPQYVDECELLLPIVEGAGILYVVDGAQPYGPEYEAEMEVLRWTGQPRMALINPIGGAEHVLEWRRALDQYFSLVRVFDAVRADFSKRIELLHAFGTLIEAWRAPLERAAAALRDDRERRQREVAGEFADLLIDVLSATESAPIESDAADPDTQDALARRLRQRCILRERAARRAVQGIYRHAAVDATQSEFGILGEDLFSASSFSLFGLSTAQLAATGAASGAVVGGGIDLLVGGASLLLGTGIGAIIGGVGAVFGTRQLASINVLGTSLGGYRLTLGPIANANFPWVLLSRALLHHRLVAELNHARREQLVLDAQQGEHYAHDIDARLRGRLESVFSLLRRGEPLDSQARTRFADDLRGAIRNHEVSG